MSKYQRKTRDYWTITGHYAHGAEEVTAETTRAAALENLRAYRENEPGVSFTLAKKRERIEAQPAPAPASAPVAVEVRPYIVKIKHDKGTATIYTSATSSEAAAQIVADAEGAPRSAVVEVKEAPAPQPETVKPSAELARVIEALHIDAERVTAGAGSDILISCSAPSEARTVAAAIRAEGITAEIDPTNPEHESARRFPLIVTANFQNLAYWEKRAGR